MHRAPWAKTSILMGLFRQMWAMSSRLTSRLRTTQPIPSLAAASTPAREWTVIWVLPWRDRSGTISRARAARPQSWTMTASTPARLACRSRSPAAASSRSVTRVFTVR